MIIDVDAARDRHVLHGVDASRRVEALAAAGLPDNTLMQRAGEAVARLALALAPSGRSAWVLCGPGNNGGDGLEAALHLQRVGWRPYVTLCDGNGPPPRDAGLARARVQAAGLAWTAGRPDRPVDIAIDALFGLGAARPLGDEYQALLAGFHAVPGPRLAVDLPSGLDADRGVTHGVSAVRATDTLALLTLKPGLLTANGRDHAGHVWFDDLGAGAARHDVPPCAVTVGPDAARSVRPPRAHASHKGSFGDVLAIGGARGMSGALVLASRAALAAGAGRVYTCPLDPQAPQPDPAAPELMWRSPAAAMTPGRSDCTIVAGCGGGDRIGEILPWALAQAPRLVLDADALNAIAADPSLQIQVRRRADRGLATVLTPHPLEAARLLDLDSARAVQADRLRHADALVRRYACTVLLKGSGTVVAAPGRPSAINLTGSARLATAGSGDVLAGWIAGLWSAVQGGDPAASPFDVACAAAYEHGRAAGGSGAGDGPLTASALLARLAST